MWDWQGCRRAAPCICSRPLLRPSPRRPKPCLPSAGRARFPSTPERLVLPAGAGLHGHVGVHLQNHITVLIQEEDPERVHLVRDAARLRDAGDDAHGPDDALDGGVVGRADDLQAGGAQLPGALPSPSHGPPAWARRGLRTGADPEGESPGRASGPLSARCAPAVLPLGLGREVAALHGAGHLGAPAPRSSPEGEAFGGSAGATAAQFSQPPPMPPS